MVWVDGENPVFACCPCPELCGGDRLGVIDPSVRPRLLFCHLSSRSNAGRHSMVGAPR